MKRHLPNFLTCCNLLCGALGIIYIFHGYDWDRESTSFFASAFPPAVFVWAACVFDFFDGFAARALKVTSPIGKELDSLADMVSFGLFPALFMYKFIQQNSAGMGNALEIYLPYAALAIAVFSALRLAIFNVDETQKDSFRGLPTPANTIFITGLPFVQYAINPWILVMITVLFSWLLVSRIELFALKFKDFTWNTNRIQFTFLALCLIAAVVFKFAAIPAIILLYIGLSLGRKVIA
jgi:CDP-diacylglycerol---serine O-phosphatidyltransferase